MAHFWRPSTAGMRRRSARPRLKLKHGLEELSKLTRLVDGKRRLVSDPPLIIPIDVLVGKADARKHEQRIPACQGELSPLVHSKSA